MQNEIVEMYLQGDSIVFFTENYDNSKTIYKSDIRSHLQNVIFSNNQVKITENRYDKEIDFRVIAIIVNHLVSRGYHVRKSDYDTEIIFSK